MNKLKELEKYLDYEFSSGCFTGQDYLTFQTKYINHLKQICKENNWEFVKAHKNHYSFAAFILVDRKFTYIAISDVRYFENDWYNRVLIRTAKDHKDYIGGSNRYCKLTDLTSAINKITKTSCL